MKKNHCPKQNLEKNRNITDGEGIDAQRIYFQMNLKFIQKYEKKIPNSFSPTRVVFQYLKKLLNLLDMGTRTCIGNTQNNIFLSLYFIVVVFQYLKKVSMEREHVLEILSYCAYLSILISNLKEIAGIRLNVMIYRLSACFHSIAPPPLLEI